ncbi:hypothetical protein M3Y94_01146100 [Aphelenchoides besseyi]|nr:hypothetical protein M3Y94_01146100 [Aphelenchoides besseyi]
MPNGTEVAPAANERLPKGTELWLKAKDLEGFENITLSNADQQQFGIIDVRLEEEFAIFVIAEPALVPGRYTLHIERYTGVITDSKGVFYRDVGDVAAIATNLFPNYAETVMPCLADSLRKVSFRLSLLHPPHTVAISNMHPEQPSFNAHGHWRLSDFVQAANLPPFMFAFAILPEIYEKTVYQQLQEPLAFTHVSIVFLPEIKGTQSTGILFLDEDAWEEADECHRIEMLATAFIRQWMGGLATVDSGRYICFQEDVVKYLAIKIVNRIIKSAEKFAQYRLANYVRIQVAEVFFAPDRSLYFHHSPDESEVEIICGGKGAQFLESLETVFGADSILKKIRALIREFAYRNFSLEDFLALLRFNIVDSVDLAQIYEFWFRTAGIANLRVEQINERLRLTQINSTSQPMPLNPIRIAVRNLSLPVSFMLSQGLDLAPLDSKLLPLTNLGYGHVYRVNYDSRLWERILRHLEDTPHLFSPLARAQLLNDYCYFGALDMMEKATLTADFDQRPLSEVIRESTKGKEWFDMPATEITDENRRDLELLQMRKSIDPKAQYRRNDLNVLPKYFQQGKVVDNSADYYSSRIPQRERKQTMVDELMNDYAFLSKSKQRYSEAKAREALKRKRRINPMKKFKNKKFE